MITRPPLRLVALVVFGSVVVGCGGAVDPAGTAPSKYPPYRDVAEVNAQITLAYQAIMSYQDGEFDAVYFQCMADAGFDIPAAVRPVRASSRQPMDSLTGVPAFETAPVEVIAKFGYEVPPPDRSDDDDDLADPLTDWIEALSPAEQERYAIADLGTGKNTSTVVAGGMEDTFSTDGCDAEATRAEMGDLEQFNWTDAETNDLNMTIVSNTYIQDVYREALAAWQECVAAAGLDVTDPNEATGTVEQAVADRTCRDQVGLTAARNDARLAAANNVRDRLNDIAITAQEIIDR